MNKAIYFKTSVFDPTKEELNPINPIYGSSLINWIKDKLSGIYDIEEAMPEDWGWYSYIKFNGRDYLIGSIAYFEEGDIFQGEIEWAFQVDKIRTFKEKLLAKEKMHDQDACFVFFQELFKNEPEFHSVEIV
ncbi:hypothetical protein [Simiduia aestuariiviva]|uniref:Uncharacterized protein n=1 Tax=Simiduia aestuariiviva TaxID=1510459 RepID=A0A839UI49_9GAMM|nr:hypothetical protein [Simiduia aestuariiviva]MBB3167173.1 hypothetical protein [Simiduia aestuariiviva]